MREREREQMTGSRRRAYEQRRRLLGATLAALELGHSTRTRQRAHEFCFNMTIHRNSLQKVIPVDSARGAGELVGGEDQGYFDPDNAPWRNYGLNDPGTIGNNTERNNEEDAEDNESEAGENESEDTRVAR